MPVGPIPMGGVGNSGNFGSVGQPSVLPINASNEATAQQNQVAAQQAVQGQQENENLQSNMKDYLSSGGTLAKPEDFDTFLGKYGPKLAPNNYLKLTQAKRDMADAQMKYSLSLTKLDEAAIQNVHDRNDRMVELVADPITEYQKDVKEANGDPDKLAAARVKYKAAHSEAMQGINSDPKDVQFRPEEIQKIGAQTENPDHAAQFYAQGRVAAARSKAELENRLIKARSLALEGKGVVQVRDKAGETHFVESDGDGGWLEGDKPYDMRGSTIVAKPSAAAAKNTEAMYMKPDGSFQLLNYRDGKHYDPQTDQPVDVTGWIKSSASQATIQGRDLYNDRAQLDAATDWLMNGVRPQGVGTMAQNVQAKVANRKAKLEEGLGLSAFEAVNLKNDNKARQKALGNMENWAAGIDKGQIALHQTMDQVISAAQELYAKYPETDIQTINKAIIAGTTEFGSPEATKYASFVRTARTDFARLQSGPLSNAMLPEGAQEKADKTLSEASSVDQLKVLQGVFDTDAEIAKSSAGKVVDKIHGDMTNPFSARPGGSEANPPPKLDASGTPTTSAGGSLYTPVKGATWTPLPAGTDPKYATGSHIVQQNGHTFQIKDGQIAEVSKAGAP